MRFYTCKNCNIILFRIKQEHLSYSYSMDELNIHGDSIGYNELSWDSGDGTEAGETMCPNCYNTVEEDFEVDDETAKKLITFAHKRLADMDKGINLDDIKTIFKAIL